MIAGQPQGPAYKLMELTPAEFERVAHPPIVLGRLGYDGLFTLLDGANRTSAVCSPPIRAALGAGSDSAWSRMKVLRNGTEGRRDASFAPRPAPPHHQQRDVTVTAAALRLPS
eukprot:gene7092-4494_t